MELNEYQKVSGYTAIYKDPIVYPALGLGGESGEVLELVKKMVRDDDGVLSDKRREKIKKELGDVLWYLSRVADDCDLSLEEIAVTNIDKLTSRQKRRVLTGDGDDR